jgi:hypothetical protein
MLNFGPVLEMSWEFRGTEFPSVTSDGGEIQVYRKTEKHSDFLDVLMRWMWIAAAGGFRPHQQGDWMSELRSCVLEPEQLQTLRWWSRLVELSALVDNERFILMTRTALERQYKLSQVSALQFMFDGLGLRSNPLIVLALNGSELSPAGFHSDRNAWLEAFLSILDERSLGLALVAKQPLMQFERERPSENVTEYRWRSGVSRKNVNFGLQDVLKRGAWDRLCEVLARGEIMIAKLNQDCGFL